MVHLGLKVASSFWIILNLLLPFLGDFRPGRKDIISPTTKNRSSFSYFWSSCSHTLSSCRYHFRKSWNFLCPYEDIYAFWNMGKTENNLFHPAQKFFERKFHIFPDWSFQLGNRSALENVNSNCIGLTVWTKHFSHITTDPKLSL